MAVAEWEFWSFTHARPSTHWLGRTPPYLTDRRRSERNALEGSDVVRDNALQLTGIDGHEGHRRLRDGGIADDHHRRRSVASRSIEAVRSGASTPRQPWTSRALTEGRRPM